ncbi:hypothetical protein BH23GEM3_BH23GEM3_03690 [soil metagenome]|nr:DUF4249 family protein [Gemmatimonadota bacterium]
MLLVITGCDWHGAAYPSEPDAGSLVVHGMLAEGAPEQEIILEYTRRLDEGYYRGLTPASGAHITVTGKETHAFREDPKHPGVYRASFVPHRGERYTLRIEGPAGESVTSQTEVPGSPQLISPGADTVIRWGEHVTVRWSSVPAAAGYVLIDRPPGEPGLLRALSYPNVLRDTSLIMQPGKLGGTSFHIRVVAVDANYRWYRTGEISDPEERSRTRSTVEGGYGLFGSFSIGNSRLISLQ